MSSGPAVETALDAMLAYGKAARAYCRASEAFTHSEPGHDDYALVQAARDAADQAQHALHDAIYAVHDAAAGVKA